MKILSGLRNLFSPKAQYDAAKPPVRRKAAWDYTNANANGSTVPYLPALNNRVRAAVRNDAIAASALNNKVSNLIGTGITPRPMTKDKALRAQLIALWDEWSSECDSAGVLDLFGIQSLVARSFYESGEVFIRLRQRYQNDLEVPLQLQIIESEQVSRKNEDLGNGFVIRSGIEYNPIGQRVAYWIHPSHPGETLGAKKQGDTNEPVRVPASEVLHVFKPLRPGQDRGVSIFAQILGKLESLNKFDDALLFRQEMANLFVAFIRKNPDIAPSLELEDGSTINAADIVEETMLKPGATRELDPGEDVQFSSPPDAGNNYPDFTRQQLRYIATGTGIPYELLSGDFSQVNDRTMRIALNNFKRQLEQDQWQHIIAQFLKPLRKAWLDNAILAGHIDMSQRDEAKKTKWAPHAHPYIHPVQDIQSHIMSMDAGIKSLQTTKLEMGYDLDESEEQV